MGWVYNATPEQNAMSNYPTVIAVCVALTVLMTGTVSTRLLVRTYQGRIGADDYIVLVGMIFSIVYSSLCITQTRYGLGLPLDERPKANLSTYMKVNFAGRPFYQLGVGLFKLALCVSYLRLLDKTTKRPYRFVVYFMAAFSTSGHVACTLVLIFNCRPVAASWDPNVKGTCLPFGPTNYCLAGFTILCDLIIIALPIPLLLSLKIRPAHKAGVICLFLLGFFTTFCSVMRLTQIQTIAYGDGNSTMLVLWGTVEFNVGMIISSMPYLAPMLKHWISDFGHQFGYSKGRSRGNASSGNRYAMHAYAKDISANRERSGTASSHYKPTLSDEHILLGREHPGDKIIRTTEYRVTVDDHHPYHSKVSG
ncbi:hypothetical protein VTN31DRAFT_6992 [Thermomyces dupontii]|uniref:uncharacterized protein n=1 Tax=Talaromyces thermophilus TaxID=28565 RepID=UPI0037447C54